MGIPWDVIFAATADAVVIYDTTGQPTWANPAAVSAFGWTMADIGARIMAAESPAMRALRGETVQGERAAITDASGRELAVPVTAVPLRAGDALIGAIVIWHAPAEAASRNQHELGLAVSRRLVEAQEAERRRIARELHDEVGQALTAVKINLQALESQGAALAMERRLKDSIAVVERALQQVRNISLDLRPSLLDDLGLVSALRWYVDNQAQRAGLSATFTAAPPDLRLPADLETACFRVAQEALTNVIRHAHATRVEVNLASTGHGVRLLIRDNGVGFNVPHALAQAAHGKSLGLVGLRERAALAGGRLEIISARGSGTEVRAWFPTESPEELR